MQMTQGRSVLEVDTAGLYRPVTRETRDAFEALLAFIRERFDDQPHDVLRGTADELLLVLKNEGLKVWHCSCQPENVTLLEQLCSILCITFPSA